MTTQQITLSQILGTDAGVDGTVLFANVANANSGGAVNSHSLFTYSQNNTTLGIGNTANSTVVGAGNGRAMLWLAGGGTNKDGLIGFANDTNWLGGYIYVTNTAFNLYSATDLLLDVSAGNNTRLKIQGNTGQILMGNAALGSFTPTYFGGNPGVFYADSQNRSFFTVGRWDVSPFGSSFGFFKSNTYTMGALATAVTGDSSGDIVWFNNDGANWVTATRIISLVDGAVGTNTMPGSMQFQCSHSNTALELMRIRGNDYAVYIGGGSAGTAYSSGSTFAGSTRALLQMNGPAGGDALIEMAVAGVTQGYLYGYSSGMRLYAGSSRQIEFYTNGVEAGIVGAGSQQWFLPNATSTTVGGSSHLLNVYTPGASILYGIGVSLQSTGSSSHFMTFANTATGGAIGSITAATATTTAFNTSSDHRLKGNVVHLTDGLATIMNVQPRQFTWHLDNSIGKGFIAHELQEVIPEAVTHEKDGVDANGKMIIQMVDFSKVVPHLVAAVQEQQAMILELKAELKALKANVH